MDEFPKPSSALPVSMPAEKRVLSKLAPAFGVGAVALKGAVVAVPGALGWAVGKAISVPRSLIWGSSRLAVGGVSAVVTQAVGCAVSAYGAFVTYKVAKHQVGRLSRQCLGTVLRSADHGPEFKALARRLEWAELERLANQREQGAQHTHGPEAWERGLADTGMTRWLNEQGMDVWQSSLSRRAGMGNGIQAVTGERLVYSAEDLAAAIQRDPLKPGQVVHIVDQDWYFNANSLDRFEGHDIVLYTIIPPGIAWRTPNSSNVLGPGGFVSVVRGGRSYDHRLNDWVRDDVLLSSPLSATLYNTVWMPSKTLESRGILFLCKTVSFRIGGWLLHSVGCAAGIEFPRVSPLDRVKVWGTRPLQVVGVSVPRPGSDTMVSIRYLDVTDGSHVALSQTAMATLVQRARGDKVDGKLKLEPYVMQRMYKELGLPNDPMVFSLISVAVLAELPFALPSSGFMAFEESVELPEVVKPYETVPCPIKGGVIDVTPEVSCFLQTKAVLDNRNRSDPRKDDVSVPVVHLMRAIVREMVDLVLHSDERLEPISIEEVVEMQTRPLQRARNSRLLAGDYDPHEFEMHKMVVKWNPKQESHVDPKLRVTVTCPTERIVQASRFAVVLEARCKQYLPGWMPGRTPTERALLLRELSTNWADEELEGTDFEGMDMSMGIPMLEEVFDPFVLMCFHGCTEYELLNCLLEDEHSVHIRAVHPTTGKAVWGDTTGCTLSGSRWVSLKGTVPNFVLEKAAFICWRAHAAGMACRMAEFKDGLFTRRADWAELIRTAVRTTTAVYGGDDGVLGAPVRPHMARFAGYFGMKIKPEAFVDGRIEFFNRVYPDIRSTLTSYPCVRRAMAKLAVRRVGDAGFKAKWLGLLAADPVVPLLSDYAQALLRVYPDKFGDLTDKEYQMKVAAGASPWCERDYDLVLEFMAFDLGLSTARVADAITKLRAAQTGKDLAKIRLRYDFDVKERFSAVMV